MPIGLRKQECQCYLGDERNMTIC